ncbi:MAG: nitroreductase family deazaflavin-dependent oxidoreductase, partial [Acidimicrobiia bacterium]
RFANRMVTPLIRLGLPIGAKHSPMALLTVKGHKSGLPRTVPLALGRHGEHWLLVAVYGESDWSRNLEAAGEATITHGGKTTAVEARHLSPPEAAPILRDQIAGAPAMVRRMTAPYFDATADSALSDWEREAETHPVFVLSPTPVYPTFTGRCLIPRMKLERSRSGSPTSN